MSLREALLWARYRGLVARPRASERPPTLAEALLVRAGPYLRRRFTRPAIRALARCAVHGADFALLALVLRASDPLALPTVLTLKFASLGVDGAAWWLAEPLRAHARENPARSSVYARLWSCSVVVLPLVVVAFAARATLARQLVSVAELYALAVAIDLASALRDEARGAPLRATQRVYRPAWTFWLPDVFSILGTVALWWAVGPWAPGLSFLVSVLLRSGLRARALTRALRAEALLPAPRRRPVAEAPAPRWPSYASAVLSGARSALFVAACGALAGRSGYGFTVLPTALLAYGASRILYSDLVRTVAAGSPLWARALRVTAAVQRACGALFVATAALIASLSSDAALGHAGSNALLGVFVLAQSECERHALSLSLERRHREATIVAAVSLAPGLFALGADRALDPWAFGAVLVALCSVSFAIARSTARPKRPLQQAAPEGLVERVEWRMRGQEPERSKRAVRDRLRAVAGIHAQGTRHGVVIERPSNADASEPPDWLKPLVRPSEQALVRRAHSAPATFSLEAYLARIAGAWAIDREGRVVGRPPASAPVSMRAVEALLDAREVRDRDSVRYEAGALWLFVVERDGGRRELLLAPRAAVSRERFRECCFELSDGAPRETRAANARSEMADAAGASRRRHRGERS